MALGLLPGTGTGQSNYILILHHISIILICTPQISKCAIGFSPGIHRLLSKCISSLFKARTLHHTRVSTGCLLISQRGAGLMQARSLQRQAKSTKVYERGYSSFFKGTFYIYSGLELCLDPLVSTSKHWQLHNTSGQSTLWNQVVMAFFPFLKNWHKAIIHQRPL